MSERIYEACDFMYKAIECGIDGKDGCRLCNHTQFWDDAWGKVLGTLRYTGA